MSESTSLPLALQHFIENFVRPTPAEYAQLAAVVESCTIPKNTVLHHAGQICEVVYFIRSGIARQYYGSLGMEGTTWFSFAGDVLADTSFLSRQPYYTSILAVTDLEANFITYEALQNMYRSSAIWERFGRL